MCDEMNSNFQKYKSFPPFITCEAPHWNPRSWVILFPHGSIWNKFHLNKFEYLFNFEISSQVGLKINPRFWTVLYNNLPPSLILLFSYFTCPGSARLALRHSVTVLWREVRYTMKYSMSMREIPMAQAIYHFIFWLESKYKHSLFPLLANIFFYWRVELAKRENIRPAEDLL